MKIEEEKSVVPKNTKKVKKGKNESSGTPLTEKKTEMTHIQKEKEERILKKEEKKKMEENHRRGLNKWLNTVKETSGSLTPRISARLGATPKNPDRNKVDELKEKKVMRKKEENGGGQ